MLTSRNYYICSFLKEITNNQHCKFRIRKSSDIIRGMVVNETFNIAFWQKQTRKWYNDNVDCTREHFCLKRLPFRINIHFVEKPLILRRRKKIKDVPQSSPREPFFYEWMDHKKS